MRNVFVLSMLFITTCAQAQPYIDVIKLNGMLSPNSASTSKTEIRQVKTIGLGVNIPIELKKGGDAIILNPFYEYSRADISSSIMKTTSKGIMIGLLKKNILKNWNLLAGFLVRNQKQSKIEVDNSCQFGGVALMSWQKNPSTVLKFGLYYNKEFFGNYFIPLLGIDWKINQRNNLFGVLPGSLVFEHKSASWFYFGGSFRALTSSFQLNTADPCALGDCSGKNYLRVDDNQLGVFADSYLSKNLVITIEGGYTILRRYRYGFKGDHLHTFDDFKNDHVYLKASLAYRLRFR